MSVADKSGVVNALRQSLPWRTVRRLQGPLLVALAYYLGAEAAFYIGTLSDKIFALFWPPNVILFFALVIAPQRQWWLYIAAALPAHVVAEMGVGMPVLQLLVAFVTNCMVAVLSAYAVRRFIGDPPRFDTFQNAALYIFITAGPCPAISAFGGAFVPILGGGSISDYWLFWSHWYLANALPNLTLGPVFLIWFSDGVKWSRWTLSRQIIEPVLLALVLIGMCIVVVTAARALISDSYVPVLLLAPLPLTLWGAVRHGARGASGAILIVSVIFTWRTLHDPALFIGQDPERSVLALQLFLTALAIPVLLLGAVIDELRRSGQLTRSLAASLVTAQDDERRRIARDLHDSTGQNLIAATLIAAQIQKLLPPSGERILGQLEEVLQQAIREIRTVSYLLHPPLLDEAGLGLALRDYVNGYAERSGIKVDLDVAHDLNRLPPDTELVLFRIVQEALTNVARHSKSTTARIHLDQHGAGKSQTVVLTIEDAGKGMQTVQNVQSRRNRTKPASGIGIVSMRERVHQVGGRLDVETASSGTIVRAVIPVAVTAAH